MRWVPFHCQFITDVTFCYRTWNRDWIWIWINWNVLLIWNGVLYWLSPSSISPSNRKSRLYTCWIVFAIIFIQFENCMFIVEYRGKRTRAWVFHHKHNYPRLDKHTQFNLHEWVHTCKCPFHIRNSNSNSKRVRRIPRDEEI